MEPGAAQVQSLAPASLATDDVMRVDDDTLDAAENAYVTDDNNPAPFELKRVGTPAGHLLDKLRDHSSPRHIVTFCQDLDALLGGGIRIGEVTEIAGQAGIGKTQLAMQLCLDVAIPEAVGGCSGCAVYIDTEGALFPSRLQQMAEATGKHIERIADKRPGLTEEGKVTLRVAHTARYFQDRIFVKRATSLQQLKAVLFEELPAFLKQQPDVKLVVVDSIAYHYRYADISVADWKVRSRDLSTMSSRLHMLALQHDVAVVVTNHMTTKLPDKTRGPSSSGSSSTAGAGAGSSIGTGGGEDRARAVPALMEVWQHTASARIQLAWDTRGDSPHCGKRMAYLTKSAMMRQPLFAHFAIVGDGVRGIGFIKTKSSRSSRRAGRGNSNSSGPTSASAGQQQQQVQQQAKR